MTTLSYGYYRPDTGDTGFWDELEDNWTRVNDHNHDGVDSAMLTVSSLASVSQAIVAASWGSVSGGVYSQVVTMTSPISYDETNISFRDTTTKEILYLRAVKASSNSYTLYSNDNTLNVTAVYR